MSEFLAGLLEANIAAAAAVAVVLSVRGWVRRHSGAHAAYLLWAIVPVAMLATLVPARTVMIEAPASLLAFDMTRDTTLLAKLDADGIGATFRALPWLWIAGLAATAIWLLLGQARFLGDVKRGKAGPAVVGLLRPHIVIPSDFGGRFEAREQELILAHEHFHLARHDARLNTLVALVRCVCWFNPMIHVGAHVMRIDQELSCDAAVVGRRPGVRRAYAETLLKTQLAARPLPMGCYWPAGTQHPLTERIAMLTRTSPSRRTRLLATAAVVMITAGAGVASWAAQPERMVIQQAGLQEAPTARTPQKPPRQTAEAEQADAAVQAQYWLDRRIELLRAELEQRPPPAPEVPRPAPTRDFFVPVPPAPEAPQAAPAPTRDFFVPIPPVPEAPLADPAPLEAPQELTQAERDALIKEMEAQRREMEVQRQEMERQRLVMEEQRKQLEVQRKEFEILRQRLQLSAQSRVDPGELKLDRPLDGATLRKLPPDVQRKLELAIDGRFDGVEVKKLPPEVLKKLDGAVIRNKIVTQGPDPARLQKFTLRRLEDQLSDLRKAESLATDETSKTKLNEAIRMLEELEKRGPNQTQDKPQ